MKPLRIFTSCWGDKHVGYFEKYLLPSLKWNKNKDSLEGANWTILTNKNDHHKLEELIKASGIKVNDINYLFLPDEFNPHAAGALINQALVMEMSECISYGAQMFLAPPDTVFGDGSIYSMRELARQRDSVVFAVHMRVHPDIALEDNMSNARLVKNAFASIHKTWSEAQDGLTKINSYIGGVSWRYVGDNLFAVTHRLPTPYIFNWTPDDIVFFKNQLHWGCIDHLWPDQCLIHTERMRVIGGSDAAFMVEITEPEQNVPPVAAYHENEPDLFWRTLSHNKTNRMFSVILRGE